MSVPSKLTRTYLNVATFLCSTINASNFGENVHIINTTVPILNKTDTNIGESVQVINTTEKSLEHVHILNKTDKNIIERVHIINTTDKNISERVHVINTTDRNPESRDNLISATNQTAANSTFVCTERNTGLINSSSDIEIIKSILLKDKLSEEINSLCQRFIALAPNNLNNSNENPMSALERFNIHYMVSLLLRIKLFCCFVVFL